MIGGHPPFVRDPGMEGVPVDVLLEEAGVGRAWSASTGQTEGRPPGAFLEQMGDGRRGDVGDVVWTVEHSNSHGEEA
jgi:hypothetical protein